MGVLSVWLISSAYSIFILLPLLARVGQRSFEPELEPADVLLLIIVIMAGPVAIPALIINIMVTSYVD